MTSPSSETVSLKLPSGEMVDAIVPAGMSDAQISLLMKSKRPDLFPQKSLLQKGHEFSDQALTGAMKSAGQLPALLSRGINKIPYIGETLAPSQGVKAFQKMTTLGDNLPEHVGAAGEQLGEMALTGGPLKAGAEALATKVPFLAKFAAPAARIGAEAINTGSSAAIHGQPVGPSAAMGAGGAAISEVGRAVAPGLIQHGLGIFGKDMQRGQTPGRAILDETSSLSPKGITKQASAKASSLTQKMELGVSQATGTVSTDSAHQVLDNAIAKAPRNATTYREKLNSLRDLLQLDNTGRRDFTPDELLEMKRGINKEVGSWDRDIRRSVDPVTKQLYGSLDKQLDSAVPGNAETNQTISSLITGSKAAKATAMGRRRGLVGQIVQRGVLPTAAGALGYQQGGAKGAALGMTAGALGMTPQAYIIYGRLLNSGLPTQLARGLATQLTATKDTGQ